MVDVSVSTPRQHPTYPYVATVDIIPASLEKQIMQHIAQNTPLLLSFKRSVLHSASFKPQSVARGLFQKVVDMKAHGMALTDQEITEADARMVSRDAQILSDELHVPKTQSYHGLIRYDVFVGRRSVLRSMMQHVAMKPSIAFVYRLSGISRTFTHLYFDNFYSAKMKEKNLNSIIDQDLVFLILSQLKQAGVSPKAFMIERYDFEPQSEIHYYEEALATEFISKDLTRRHKSYDLEEASQFHDLKLAWKKCAGKRGR
ncbi:hypothetical protein MRX96_019863 [Rhipicephalus microplus]